MFATFAGGYSRKPLPAQPDVLGDAEQSHREGHLDDVGLRSVRDDFVREILDEMRVVGLGIVGDGGVREPDRVTPWIRGLEGLAVGAATTWPDGEPATRPAVDGLPRWTRPVRTLCW